MREAREPGHVSRSVVPLSCFAWNNVLPIPILLTWYDDGAIYGDITRAKQGTNASSTKYKSRTFRIVEQYFSCTVLQTCSWAGKQCLVKSCFNWFEIKIKIIDYTVILKSKSKSLFYSTKNDFKSKSPFKWFKFIKSIEISFGIIKLNHVYVFD